MVRNLYTILCLISGLLLACSSEKPESGKRPLITVSTSMLGDAAKSIFGKHCEIYVLMGPGSNPHAYRPSPLDVYHLKTASIIWANGAHLEGKMNSLWPSLRKKIPVFTAEETLPDTALIFHDAEPDPHFWFDPLIWIHAIDRLSEQTGQLLFPENTYWRSAKETYLNRIIQVHETGLQLMNDIAPEQRALVTTHDAFSYFGRRYGFELFALQGTSTLSEYGMFEILQLAETLKTRKIPAIFTEANQNSYGLQSLQRSCRHLGHPIDFGPELLTDAISPACPTYPDMLLHNFKAIYSVYHAGNSGLQP